MKPKMYRVYYTYIQTDVYEIEADSSAIAEEQAKDKGEFLFETREFQSVEAEEDK